MIIPSGRRVRPAIPDLRKRKEGFIAATLKVLDRAFRFTTDAAVKRRTTGDITVQFPTVTAGNCGTDIWGKNLGDKEVMVLIEGKITVNRRGDPSVQMKDALTYLLEALSRYDSLRRDGYPVRILPRQADGEQLYRLRLAGFSTEQQANALGVRLKQGHPRLEPIASLQ